jgi:hypothetical protein
VSRPAVELADIFRRCGAAYRQQHQLPRQQLRVMRAIEACRTAVLGGHKEVCSHCSHSRIAYNSCRNRHCPKCQNKERAQWLRARQSELLPVEYFHVVFTLPDAAARLALQNQALLYSLLFHSASQTLLEIARDPKHLGAAIGFFGILHTWGQNLLHHPHVHFVIPGGGIGREQQWVACRRGFFLPVRVLSRRFRRRFLEGVYEAFSRRQLTLKGQLEPLQDAAAFDAHIAALERPEWVVYAKPPFGGPRQVLDYLGRYSHRVALSNDRLLGLTDDSVSFRWKDYRHKNGRKHKWRVLTLPPAEFLRRFLLHTLPPGFQRIRHFGFLANRFRAQKLALCRSLLRDPITDLLPHPCQTDQAAAAVETALAAVRLCPLCQQGVLVRISIVPAYAWPAEPPPDSS